MKRLLACLLATWFLVPAASAAVLLDTELDLWFRNLAAPLQKQMSQTADARIVLVPDDTLNAYVTGEKIVHIHSGLILQADNAAEIQGVIAHELGHVAAQHINRMQDQMGNATLEAIAGMALGAGAAIAGAPQAGAAIMATSQAGAISGVLRHSRTQESEADRRALAALHAAHLQARPLVTMMSKLRTDAQLSYDTPPPYLLTHPLPATRMSALEGNLKDDPAANPPLPALAPEAFTRIQAKVAALTRSPAEVLRHYPGDTDPEVYARSIAYARQGRIAEAESTLAPLITAHPADPFYLETRGLIALDAGNLPAAEADLKSALALLQPTPEATLYLRYQLAEVLRAKGQPAQALPLLQEVTREFPLWATPWQSLGIVYGELGRLPESHLALAEESLTRGNKADAKEQLAYARNYIKKTPNPQATNWAETLQTRLDSLPTR